MTSPHHHARATSAHVGHLRGHHAVSGVERSPPFVKASQTVERSIITRKPIDLNGAASAAYGRVECSLPHRASADLLDGWWPEYGKRCFDVVFSSVALVLLSPALILIAILVRLSGPGPVFFRQMRHGRDCKLFSIYKFRTMVATESSGGIVIQTKEHDERVSRIGAFLRRTSLDELPQLFNVLAGDMSIVGPRPHAPLTVIGDVFFETLAMTENYGVRYSVRPGITGLAQVSGCRGAMLTREVAIQRLERDIQYLREQSVWLEMKIIIQTFINEFLTGRAH
jgi:lipopolysaccharide/colanic/teichoic acid biosynthesis glycosyltransferase